MSVIDPRELRPLRDSQGPAQITGEAVALEVPAAGLGWRALSGVIDLVVEFLGLALFMTAAGSMFPDVSTAVGAGIAVIASALCFVVVPATIEVLNMGQSLGKLITSLRVVRMDGGAISFRHSLTRAFVGFVETVMTFGCVAFLTAAFTTRSRRLGDLAAGTYVVREPRAFHVTPPPQMPAALALWANEATVLPLPPQLAARMSSLVHLGAQPSPYFAGAVQATLGDVLPYVSPLPPPGRSPFDVLTAVAVIRRDGDVRGLQRDEQVRRRMLGTTPAR